MSYYVLMQKVSSQGKVMTLPLKIFSDLKFAETILNKEKEELNLLKGLKFAYNNLIQNYIDNSSLVHYKDSLDKEKDRISKIIGLTAILDRHGISVEDELPVYYLVEVELETPTD